MSSSIPASRYQRPPHVTDQDARNNCRHGKACDNAPFGIAVFGDVKIDPADEADKLVSHLEGDPLAERAQDDGRLGYPAISSSVDHSRLTPLQLVLALAALGLWVFVFAVLAFWLWQRLPSAPYVVALGAMGIFAVLLFAILVAAWAERDALPADPYKDQWGEP